MKSVHAVTRFFLASLMMSATVGALLWFSHSAAAAADHQLRSRNVCRRVRRRMARSSSLSFRFCEARAA